MPYSPEEIKYILAKEGYDSNNHTISDDGFIVPKAPSVIAQQNNLQIEPTNSPAPTPSVINTAGRAAAENLLPAVGGGLTAAGVIAGLGSGVGTIPTIAAITAGLAGGMGTKKLQDTFVPDEVKQQFFLRPEDAAANPIAAAVGSLAPNLLFGNPAKGIANLAGVVKDAPSILRGAKALTDIQKEVLKQAAIGSGINLGVSAIQNKGEVSPTDIATGVVGGSLFNTPWQKNPLNGVFGLTPHPQDYRTTGLVPKTTGFEGESSYVGQTPIMSQFASRVPEAIANEIQVNQLKVKNDAAAARLASQAGIDRDVEALAKQDLAAYEAQKQKAANDEFLKQQTEQALQEATSNALEVGAAENRGDSSPYATPVMTKVADRVPKEITDKIAFNDLVAKNDAKAAELARQAEMEREVNVVARQKMAEVEAQKQSLANEEFLRQKAEKDLHAATAEALDRTQAELLQAKLANIQAETAKLVDSRNKIENNKNTTLKVAVSPSKVYEGELAKLSSQVEAAQKNLELEQAKSLKGVKNSEVDPNAPINEPPIGAVSELDQQLADRRGVALQSTELPEGVKGQMQYSTRQAKVDPSQATSGTVGHEVGVHGFWRDLLYSSDPKDVTFAKNVLALAKGNEEALARIVEPDIARRQALKAGGSLRDKILNWFADVKNNFKKQPDLFKMLANRAIHDAPFGTRAELINEKTVGPAFRDMQGIPEGSLALSGAKGNTSNVGNGDEEVKDSRAHWNTPEFKDWFGNSKIVNEDGTPKVVYHGTKATPNFSEFKPTGNEPLSHFGDTQQANEFSASHSQYQEIMVEKGAHTPKSYPVYLSIENPLKVKDYFGESPTMMLRHLRDERIISPYDLEHIEHEGSSYKSEDGGASYEEKDTTKWKALTRVLGKKGYDGFVYQNTNEGRVGHPDNIAYVPFDNTQIKSASGNTGGYSSHDSDIRYSKVGDTISGALRHFMPEIDAIASDKEIVGGEAVSKHLHDLHNTESLLKGRLTAAPLHEVRAAAGFGVIKSPLDYIKGNSPVFDRVLRYRREMYKDGKSGVVLNANEKKVNEAVTAFFNGHATERNTTPGLHVGSIDKNYINDTISHNIFDILNKSAQSPASIKLKKDFLDYQTKALVADGRKLPDAQKEAQRRLNEVMAAMQYDKQVNLAEHFGPLDEHKGYGLPDSWKSNNLMELLQTYGNRSAKRLAYAKEIENTPAKEMLFNPEKENLSANPRVAHVLKQFTGLKDKARSSTEGVNGVIAAALTGTFSGVRDVVTTQTLGAQHMGLGQVPRAIVHGIANAGKNWSESLSQGVRTEHIGTIEGLDSISGLSGVTSGLRKLREIVNVVQGRSTLESIGRTMAYGQGKFLAHENIDLYRRGKLTKGSQQEKFLDDFGPEDWRKKFKNGGSEEDYKDLATKFSHSVTQTYNAQDLPRFATDSPIAPFLQLSRWNIGKANNFVKYTIQPAMRGNYKPLLSAVAYTLLGGGAAIESLNELISKRRSKLPSVSELQAVHAMDGKTGKMLAYKIAGMAALSGFGGELANLTKMTFDKALGNRSNGYEFLLVHQLSTLQDHVPALVDAAASNDVSKTVDILNSLLENSFQNYRVALAHLSKNKEAKIEHSNKYTDERLYEQSFKDNAAITPDIKPDYSNYHSSEFRKLNPDTVDSSESVGTLLNRAIQEVMSGPGDASEKSRKLTGLKHGSQQFFPDVETDPVNAGKYMQFLNSTGKNGGKRYQEFLGAKEFQKFKSSLVPSLGL